MAQVTVELGQLLDKTDFQLFDFDYEFDDEIMKAQLEDHVLEFFYDYEIGQATPDMFKRKFKARWKRIISYYNKLHNTTLLQYDPLINHKMSEALSQLSSKNRTNTGTSTTSNTGSTDVTDSSTTDQTTTNDNTRTDDLSTSNTTNEKTSDYPQQPIAGGDYLNGERDATSDTTNTGTVKDAGSSTLTGTASGTANTSRQDDGTATSEVLEDESSNSSYDKTIEGLTGKSYQELIQLERQNIVSMTTAIINEMKPCFILVY